jgi:hypothetical protein
MKKAEDATRLRLPFIGHYWVIAEITRTGLQHFLN